MKKNLLSLIMILLSDIVYGQGIKFEEGLSWVQLKAKAKSENKYIFMDCYATWCGPCKWMNQNIFTSKEVGVYMSDKFICVAVQMDRTKADMQNTRDWYESSQEIGKMYSVNSYPTYLFFSADGNAVHRIVGTTGQTVKDFTDKVADAFDPARQYYKQIAFVKGNDSTKLHDQLVLAVKQGDKISAEPIAEAYLTNLKNPFDNANIALMIKAVNSSQSSIFNFFLNNVVKVNLQMEEKDYTEYILDQIVLAERLDVLFIKGKSIDLQKFCISLKKNYPQLGEMLINRAEAQFKNNVIKYEIRDPYFQVGASPANWVVIANKFKTKYPGFDAKRVIADQKWQYYSLKKMRPEYEQSMLNYIKSYSNTFDVRLANSLCWDIFISAKDGILLQKAVDILGAKVIGKQDAYAEHIDTYACLLYKLGKKEEAIKWETKAVEVSRAYSDQLSVKRESIITLEKMKRDEVIWPENIN